jgi:hypothetical protein
MNNQNGNGTTTFKYNVSFYYQSTIIYLVVFLLYLIIRGEFVEHSFTLVTKDPVLYLLAIIVLISVSALLYNLFKNKHLQITEDQISFIDRFKTRTIKIDQIKYIRFSKQRRDYKFKSF